MLTLSQATSETRAVLKWGAVLILLFFAVIILIRLGSYFKDTFFPTPPPPPTVSFGKLPLISFPSDASDKNFNYSLDTLSGALPPFPDRMKVFRIVSNSPDLLALQRARDKVSTVGISSGETSISNQVYQWNDGGPLNKTITMNIFSQNFSLSSSFTSDPIVLAAGNLPDPNGAITTAQTFLSSIKSFPDDIDIDKSKTLLFSINNNTLTSATSVSNAQIIEVDFFQKDIDKTPIYYPKAVNSTMSVLVAAGQDQAQVVQVNFYHQNIASDSATYPIKNAQQAYDELKQGKGYVASYFGNSDNISIKNVSLGYYMSDKKQDYLLPIAVFEGNDGFFAYVPLTSDEWISK